MNLVSKTQFLSKHLHNTWTRRHPTLLEFHNPQIPKSSSINRNYYLSTNFNNLSTSSIPQPQSPVILFVREENKNAERFFRNAPLYKSLVFHLDNKNSSNSKSKFHPAVESFIKIAMNPENVKQPVISAINKGALDEVISNLKSLKDEDLLQVLYHLRFFALCSSVRDPEYYKVWKALDQECLSRLPTWTVDYLFIVADLWDRLHLARSSSFHWGVVKKCFRKCDRLTKEQFVRFMFCLNLNRSLPESMNMYELEYFLNKVADKLSAQEIAIVAMGFFKTETQLQDKQILNKLLDTVIKEASTLNSIDVAAVAKLARFCSSPKSSKEIILRFQQAFLPELERLSIAACTHLALVGTSTQTPHLELVNAVVKKIQRNLKEARLKEIERISLAMTMFNADCDDLCHQIVEELRSPERADEIRKYGRCLPAILHYMSFREIFPEDLISMALSEEFRKQYYGSKWETHQRELLCLDFAAGLEIPKYSGERLDLKTNAKLCKINFHRIPNSRVSMTERVLQSIVEVMEPYLGGTDFVYPCNILPQHNSVGVVYCTDNEGKAVKVPVDFRSPKGFEVKYIPTGNENIHYHVILPCTKNMILSMNGSEVILSGQARLQVRQLQKMGYRVQTVKVDMDRIKIDIQNILENSSTTPIDKNGDHAAESCDQQPELNVIINSAKPF